MGGPHVERKICDELGALWEASDALWAPACAESRRSRPTQADCPPAGRPAGCAQRFLFCLRSGWQ